MSSSGVSRLMALPNSPVVTMLTSQPLQPGVPVSSTSSGGEPGVASTPPASSALHSVPSSENFPPGLSTSLLSSPLGSPGSSAASAGDAQRATHETMSTFM